MTGSNALKDSTMQSHVQAETGTNMPISLPSHTSLQQDLGEDEYIDSENGLIYCARCHTPRQGRYRLRLLGRDLTPRILCRCQMEERKILDEERTRKEQMTRVSRLRASGLQNKFLHECRFEKDTLHSPQLAKARSYVENWDTMKKTGQGLLLWGPVGRGKTFFAGCIANALIDRCVPVLMTGIPDILSELAAQPPSERNHFIDSFNAYSLLILDDLGVERNSEYATEQVFRLIGWLGRFFGGLCETSIPRPPAWTVILFLAAMFYLLHAKHWGRAALAAALMGAMIASWCFRAAFFPAEVLIMSGGGTEQEPAVVVTDPALGRADVVNVPDYRTGSALADYLHERGITACRSVAVSSGRKASFDGLDTFAAQIPILNIYSPSNALSKMPDGPAVTMLPYTGAITSYDLSDEHFSFSIGTIDGILLSNHTGRGHLTLRKDGIPFVDAEIPQTSARRLHIRRIETIPSSENK